MFKELLESWKCGTTELPIPIEDQAKLLSKKYTVERTTIKVNEVNPETGNDELYDKSVLMICFKDIICKFRPHLHLGDYWLHITVRNDAPDYRFYYRVEFLDGVQFNEADHPHLSGGRPCLGSHQGDIGTAINGGNYIRFMSQMKQYLQSYYGRSTYTRGSEYKKMKIRYQLHSEAEIRDIFSTEMDDPDSMDVYGIAEDSFRWNFPQDMKAWGDFTLQGQELRYFMAYMRANAGRLHISSEFKDSHPFPFLDGSAQYLSSFTDSHRMRGRDDYLQKIIGYIYVTHTVGEMPIFKAIEFVRIFILKLWIEYMGELDADVMKELRKMSDKLSNSTYGNKWTINTRYSVVLDESRRDLVSSLSADLTKVVGRNGAEDKFIKELKFAGNKMANFIILIRKGLPDAASCQGYLYNPSCTSINYVDYKKRYANVEKFVYRKALDQLEKDKRRFVNELNRPDIVHIPTDDGQATLFSEEL